MRRTLCSLALLSLVLVSIAAPLEGQTTPALERVLLPVTVRNSPGAFGTMWDTNLWIRVATHSPTLVIAPILPVQDCDPPDCRYDQGIVPIDADYSYPIDFYHTHAGEMPGQIIYLSLPDSDDIHLSVRLNSGLPGSVPVELPAVRERYFTSRTLQILGVPIGSSASRAFLRIYGIDPDKMTSVHVKAFVESLTSQANSVVFESDVPLSVSQEYLGGNPALPLRPPAAELNLSKLIDTTASEIRLEIGPNDPSMRLWAFVSLTDNATQQVTLRTPN